MAKAPKQAEPPKHVGRSPELSPEEILKLEPKVAARRIAIHEGNRILSEGVHAVIDDLLGDIALKVVKGMHKHNPIRVFVELQEFRAEHTKEEEQGKEHKENMALLTDRTLTMYRATLEKESNNKSRDAKKYGQIIQVLEYIEASNTGDAQKMKLLREKHPHITEFVEKMIFKNSKEISKLLRKAILEGLDVLPGVSPESAMEVVRLAELQLVCSLFNQHLDVSKEERIPITKGGIKGAYGLYKQRLQHAREHFSMWKETKDFVKAYWKFVRTGNFT